MAVGAQTLWGALSMFTPQVGEHTLERNKSKWVPLLAWYHLLNTSHKVHLSPKHQVGGERKRRMKNNTLTILKGPQWIKHELFFLIKKIFVKNNAFAPFCIMYKNKSQTWKWEKDAKILWMYNWHLQDCTFLTVMFTKGFPM